MPTMKNEAIKEAFRKHYESDESWWHKSSGPGSSPYHNIDYRAFIERFIYMNNIKSVIDIGCGDWQFSRFINYENIRYYGYDIVDSIIMYNKDKYSTENISFDLMPNDFSELPDADLLIMKDVLQHLPDSYIFKYRDELFTKYTRCLISNSYRKLNCEKNIDVEPGHFRCLDLNDEPYNFGGNYVLEFSTSVCEEIRTMLYVGKNKGLA